MYFFDFVTQSPCSALVHLALVRQALPMCDLRSLESVAGTNMAYYQLVDSWEWEVLLVQYTACISSSIVSESHRPVRLSYLCHFAAVDRRTQRLESMVLLRCRAFSWIAEMTFCLTGLQKETGESLARCLAQLEIFRMTHLVLIL